MPAPSPTRAGPCSRHTQNIPYPEQEASVLSGKANSPAPPTFPPLQLVPTPLQSGQPQLPRLPRQHPQEPGLKFPSPNLSPHRHSQTNQRALGGGEKSSPFDSREQALPSNGQKPRRPGELSSPDTSSPSPSQRAGKRHLAAVAIPDGRRRSP